ncbi:hypothetical protein PR202_ga22122 [Eleusine coracana subsp. coracana]|uniref:Uncharacterized protein n=1 Tax=Eleusine coracana subsp. coracana TaxID=191504 RepID=A0AAV5D1E6_ELECO|nr:hypothetical protein PR202_ga22122 [Eleusine coracana subsp. coracana]
MQEIKCYVCKQNGHLCCADFLDNYSKELTCYNCAQSGHTGLVINSEPSIIGLCQAPSGNQCCDNSNFLLFSLQSNRPKGEFSSHSWRKDRGKDFGTRSAPYDACKSSKRKSPHFEDWMDTPHRHKSKARGGWNGDDYDLDDLPFKKYKPNGWPPSTPKKKRYSNHHQFSHGDGDYFTPQSSRRRDYGHASPSSNYSPSARKHGFSSRFASNNTHVRFHGN